MKDLKNKVAVVTGGANGIGLATGALLAERGMKVILADIEADALDRAVGGLTDRSLEVVGVQTDVAKFESMENLRQETIERYGKVHLAFLNAGVGAGGSGKMWDHDLKDWEWGFAVNVWGVINGIKALVPTMVAQDEDSNVVITSSPNGVIAPMPSGAIYPTTKATVLTLAECLYGQLRRMNSNVKASVMIPPGTINTSLFTGGRNRQPEYAPSVPVPAGAGVTVEESVRRSNESGLVRVVAEPEDVAVGVVDGILRDDFWIVPRYEQVEPVVQSFEPILRARFDSMLNFTAPDAYLWGP